jgi:hypothetical protein
VLRGFVLVGDAPGAASLGLLALKLSQLELFGAGAMITPWRR